MDKININNLTGKCLAAMPSLEGSFAKSLIYICSHSSDGAMGLIINKPYQNLTFADLSYSLSPDTKHNPQCPLIMQGGPLEREKGFILHDNTYCDSTTYNIADDIKISSSHQVVQNIISGQSPDNFMIILGYAGWIPQQLENEISNNLWAVIPASQQLIFNVSPEDKWSFALSCLGIDNSNFSLPLGHS